MKKAISVLLACILCFSCVIVIVSCGGSQSKLTGNVTVKEWLDKKGDGTDFTLTVTIIELVNPYYARVEDSTGSTLLFGLWEDGEPKAFTEKRVDVGDTIVIKNPEYNIYEDNVEMIKAILVKKQ